MRFVVRVQLARNPEGAACRGWLWEWRRRYGHPLVCALALGLAPAADLFAAATALEVPYFLPVDLSQVEISVTTTAVGEVAGRFRHEEKAEVDWKFSRSVRVETSGGAGVEDRRGPGGGRG